MTKDDSGTADLLSEIDDVLSEIDSALEATTPTVQDSPSKAVEEASTADSTPEVTSPAEGALEASESLIEEVEESPESTFVDTLEGGDVAGWDDTFLADPDVWTEDSESEEEVDFDTDALDVDALEYLDEQEFEPVVVKTQWRVTLPRNEQGRLLKGRAARENPGTLDFVFEVDDEEGIERSVLLTPKVAVALHEALGKVTASYENKPRKTVRQMRASYWARIKAWHRRHKVLAVANFIFLTVFGIAILFSLLQGAITMF